MSAYNDANGSKTVDTVTLPRILTVAKGTPLAQKVCNASQERYNIGTEDLTHVHVLKVEGFDPLGVLKVEAYEDGTNFITQKEYTEDGDYDDLVVKTKAGAFVEYRYTYDATAATADVTTDIRVLVQSGIDNEACNC